MRAALVLAAWLAGPSLMGVAQEPTQPYGYGTLPRGAWACLGSPRFIIDKPAACVALSPDGKLLAAGTDDFLTSNIHLWDLSTGKEMPTLVGAGGKVVALHFTPDSKKLISAGDASSILVWDLAKGKAERGKFKGYLGTLTDLETTPQGKQLISASYDGTIRVWDFARGDEVRHIGPGPRWTSLSPDGRTLAGGSGGVFFWDIQTGKLLRRFEKPEGIGRGIEKVRYSPDGKTLAVVDELRRVAIWDSMTGKERLRIKGLKRAVIVVAFSKDGKILVTGGGGYQESTWATGRHYPSFRYGDAEPGPGWKGFLAELKLWDVQSGKELSTCVGHTYYVTGITFSPDGRTLASASNDHSVRLWEWQTGREVPRFSGHSQEVSSLAYSPDGRTLYSASKDGTVRLWDAVGAKEQAVLRGHTKEVMAAVLTPDGKTLATGGLDGTVRLWDVASRRELRTLASDHGRVWCLAFSPDGRTLVSGSWGPYTTNGTVRLWDWQAGKELRRLADPELANQSGAICLAFSPGGETLAVGHHSNPSSYHAQISLWEASTGKIRGRLSNQYRDFVGSLTYLPDGSLVASGAYGNDNWVQPVWLWDPTTQTRLHEFGTTKGYNATTAVSPDGRLLAIVLEASIQVWEVSTRRKVAEFPGHRWYTASLAFSPDGRTLATGGADGAILFWDLTGRRKEGRIVGRPLQPGELDSLWKELAEDDGRGAVWTLAAAPEQAVPFLRQKLPDATKKIDPQRLRQLVADLDSVKFADRQRAADELENLGAAAEPALRLALKGNPSPELRVRASSLLKKLENSRLQTKDRLPPATVRLVRVVEVLERASMPEAVEALRAIADGEPTARLTREAQAALQRLTRLGE